MSVTTELIEKLREVAKKYYENNGSNEYEVFKYLHEAADTIEELSAKLHAANMERSSRYYHGGWIPCEEKLPKTGEDVLVTCFIHEKWQNKQGYYNGEYWIVDAYGRLRNDLIVVAWRPLPEPYSPDDKEEE